MPLWKNTDGASNSDIAAVQQVNKSVTTANQTLLFGNTKPGTFFANLAIGQFAVDTNEAQANKSIPHAGWVLRKEGQGLRAGRVEYEVLVAMGSISTDVADDTNIPDRLLVISVNPDGSASLGITNAWSMTANAYSVPAGASLTWKWQRDGGPSSRTWADISNGGVFSNATTRVLTISDIASLSGNVFRAVASATGANAAYSANASIFVVPKIVIVSQPQANTAAAGTEVVFQVNANTMPDGHLISYNWQVDGGPSSQTWINVTGANYTGNTTNTLTVLDNTSLNANNFRVTVSAQNGAPTLNSANALLTVS